MLTIIQTYTCAFCGKCETIRGTRLLRNMSVAMIDLPPNWHWVNDNTLCCDEHTISVRNKSQEEKEQA